MKETIGWLLQRVSGLFLIGGLITHFFVMHFSGHEKVTYEVVIKRLSSPGWMAFDVLFLSIVIYHGFNGLWGIALEYLRPGKLLKFCQSLIITCASLLMLVGIYIVTL